MGKIMMLRMRWRRLLEFLDEESDWITGLVMEARWKVAEGVDQGKLSSRFKTLMDRAAASFGIEVAIATKAIRRIWHARIVKNRRASHTIEATEGVVPPRHAAEAVGNIFVEGEIRATCECPESIRRSSRNAHRNETPPTG